MSKYNNTKLSTPDGLFDSKKEYFRFVELKLLEANGTIQNLTRQKRYELIPAHYETQIINGKAKMKCIERECVYVADFVYTQDGVEVVEDVKGYKSGSAYVIFSIKRKLMLEKFNIRIREV